MMNNENGWNFSSSPQLVVVEDNSNNYSQISRCSVDATTNQHLVSAVLSHIPHKLEYKAIPPFAL
jgi:hypothetical protein